MVLPPPKKPCAGGSFKDEGDRQTGKILGKMLQEIAYVEVGQHTRDLAKRAESIYISYNPILIPF